MPNVSRPVWTSVAVGIGAAGVVSLVGPLYGGLVVVLAVPVVFLTLSRMLFGNETRRVWQAILIAGGVAWLMLLPVSPFARNSVEAHLDTWPWLLLIGVVPLVAGAILTAKARVARDIPRH